VAVSDAKSPASATRADLPSAKATTLENLIGNLYIKDGSLKGKFYPIGGHAVVLGRDRSCTIVLDGDNVSREHAEIRLEGEAVVLEDKNSTNGTFVNGERVSKHELADRDEIQIGSTTILYEKR
jgi:pSer/pThr/pTyr-binding forkhead associated (FHA) protein